MVYLPPAFTETREEVLFAHIERHDFGLLVTHGAAGLIASQIPFLAKRRDGGLYLQAHIARANPQAEDFDGGEALAIFPGPHAYISPGWYEARMRVACVPLMGSRPSIERITSPSCSLKSESFGARTTRTPLSVPK